MTVECLRLLVVDNDPKFRDELCALLDVFDDLTVVGQASSGSEAMGLVASLRPHAVIMDPNLDDTPGVEVTRQINLGDHEAVVLVLTTSADDDAVLAAIRAGAKGYLLKDTAPSALYRAVRAAADGEVVFGPVIARRFVGYFSVASGPLALPELTASERAVLELMVSGLNNTEMARRLDVSPKTVRNRVSSVFRKLRVPDRARAIVLARKAGMDALADPLDSAHLTTGQARTES
ncbi:DNA-binding NarL/FixJ family response regulator [Kibdelosporangium banguiense]|uniref:DNA-binding NarL/FixJ family response regulator n=1 Tax=Kibdelosporangium banguiense TaxID=1365924 RepID=A0ABS4TYT3_9PSEU|nr:response regulator transcription factor [Kibdelosporangium banguiense]MBP2329567.1 DNA-binding NarL/FixJ family response regulator [Kibdelosporangium banguiense]